MTGSEIHLIMIPGKSHLYLEIDDLHPCHEHLASVAFSKIRMPEFEELVTRGYVVVGRGKIDIARSCCPRRIRNLEQQAELWVILFSKRKDCAPTPSLTSTTIEPSGFPCRT